MNLLHCQKMLLKTETEMEDNGKKMLDFTCERTGLHFRLSPLEHRTHEDKASSLCLLCSKHCPMLKAK